MKISGRFNYKYGRLKENYSFNLNFANGETFKGIWDPMGACTDGEFNVNLGNNNTFQRSRFNRTNCQNNENIGENTDFGKLYYFKGVESFKCTNILNSDFKLVYQNGDIIEGIFDSTDRMNLDFEGTITYSKGRYPSFTGKVENNKPISGKGVCFLYNYGNIFEGDFNENGEYTITEEDGTIHKMINKPSLEYEREIIYPDGKSFKGTFQHNGINLRTSSGEGYLHLKYENAEIEIGSQNLLITIIKQQIYRQVLSSKLEK